VSNWQPIETAPRGELIQLYWPDICDKPLAGFYEATTCGSGWHTAMNAFAWQTSPTHWMPLPDPPGMETLPALSATGVIEEKCAWCKGVGQIGMPGATCNFCSGEGVQRRNVPNR
jgi:hypothetical protein